MKRNIFKIKVMNRYGILTILFAVAICAATSCQDYPTDDNGLLITERSECYVSSFGLYGVDYQNVLTTTVNLTNGIDTTACTINAVVFFGTDLKNLYPQFALITDAKLEPKIIGLTDFSSGSRQWTVVSGNRKVRKTYTVNLTVQTP